MRLQTRFGTVGYDEAGGGFPLVLLHGFPHDRTLWAAQLASPPPGIRLIAPDLPGFGSSDSAEVPSLDHWADWTIAFCDGLGLDAVAVGGLSMGGYLALALWRRHAARLRALVLADTKAGADSEEARAKRVAMQELALQQGAAAVADAMMPGMVGKTTRAERPGAVEYLEAMLRRAPPTAIHDALEAMRTRPDATPSLGGISVPTLVICGDEDALTPPKESEALAAAIPDSQLAIIPGAGHASCVEHPAAFNAVLAGFCTARLS